MYSYPTFWGAIFNSAKDSQNWYQETQLPYPTFWGAVFNKTVTFLLLWVCSRYHTLLSGVLLSTYFLSFKSLFIALKTFFFECSLPYLFFYVLFIKVWTIAIGRFYYIDRCLSCFGKTNLQKNLQNSRFLFIKKNKKINMYVAQYNITNKGKVDFNGKT